MKGRRAFGLERRDRQGGRLPQAGHTLVEILLVIALFSLVTAAVYSVLIGQRRFYATHVQAADTRDAVRVATEVLSVELRGLGPKVGDLYAIAADSVALRSATGIGVVCGVSGSVVSLWLVSGVFGDLSGDSALVFLENDPRTALDNAWVSLGISAITHHPRNGRCADGRSPEVELALSSTMAGVTVGSPLRGFRPYVYKLYRGGDGYWWLGQRLRGGRMQPLAGPFVSPGDGGLKFEYLTSVGSPALEPGEVSQVRFAVEARSLRPIPRAQGPGPYRDTLSAVVFLRNS
ncbi:MAG: prepilin-type N-terminal cleavage/methylation domain-containing protein [Gemmatimonadota bacterium]|nr:MAG: prepilin-type N-terminal cleavage/methylation domain-containing protein [Gemmatimonadota bacterium]